MPIILKHNIYITKEILLNIHAYYQIILGARVGQAQYLFGHNDMLASGNVPLQHPKAPLVSVDLLGAGH